jgi:glyoxylase-like metal-dependent hydrolase (beta-lactamase superfamily II)
MSKLHTSSPGQENVPTGSDQNSSDRCNRRSFLTGGMSCSAYLFFALAGTSLSTRRAFAAQTSGEKIAEEPFARVEKISEGVWAVISTPFSGEDTTTFCNGGIIQGKDAVLALEGYMTPEGAAWQSKLAEELTGRRPTHVALTHHHFDHSSGLSGYMLEGKAPKIISTGITRNQIVESNSATPEAADESNGTLADVGLHTLLPDTVIVDTSRPTQLDLGGRVVNLVPRMGHTQSDLTVELEDPAITFCADFWFNGLFPYYGDSTPTALRKNFQELVDQGSILVPGHGGIGDKQDIKNYLTLLDDVEAAARKAIEKGTPASEAWKEYNVPESLGEWTKFRPDVYSFGFEAWERELK